MIFDSQTATELSNVDIMGGHEHPPQLVITTAPRTYIPAEPRPPALDVTRPTTTFDATRFLYDPTALPDPSAGLVQWGMAARVIEPDRAALLHGRVLDPNGSPLEGVDVRVHGLTAYGQTRSRRTNGEFDLVVNGGGTVVVEYAHDGFMTAQRTVDVPWNAFTRAPDVTLMPIPDNCTPFISGTRSPGRADVARLIL